uniref:Transmembrane protein n=1 Tax=Cacopsylla melanoneura TaxID=428564 RepID=A0A8D9ALP7_9HEMI
MAPKRKSLHQSNKQKKSVCFFIVDSIKTLISKILDLGAYFGLTYYLLSVNGTLPAINVFKNNKGVLFVLLYTKIYLRLPNILLLSINFYILFVKNKHVFILD